MNGLLKLAALAVSGIALYAGPAAAQSKEYLRTGEGLGTNEYLVAANKKFFAIQQGDGNFCVYKGSGPADNWGGLWCTMKTAAGGQFVTTMQGDGNLCTYRGTPKAPQSPATWCTMKTAAGGQYFVIMQGDGNLCVYKGTGPADNKGGMWCHGAALPPKQVTLVVTNPGVAVGGVKGTGGIYSTCRPKCEVKYDFGTMVTLQVDTSGNKDVTLDRWDGACAGQGNTCTIRMDSDKATAQYMKVTTGYIDVNFKAVGASGTVNPIGEVSVNGSLRRYTTGTPLALTAVDDTLHAVTFKQWGGACASAGTAKSCNVTVTGPMTVEAQFNQGPTYLLTVTNPSVEVGGVKGTGGIYSTCRPKCEVRLARGTPVTLTLDTSGNNNIVLDRWEGPCKGQGNTCTFVLNSDMSVQQYVKKR